MIGFSREKVDRWCIAIYSIMPLIFFGILVFSMKYITQADNFDAKSAMKQISFISSLMFNIGIVIVIASKVIGSLAYKTYALRLIDRDEGLKAVDVKIYRDFAKIDYYNDSDEIETAYIYYDEYGISARSREDLDVPTFHIAGFFIYEVILPYSEDEEHWNNYDVE